MYSQAFVQLDEGQICRLTLLNKKPPLTKKKSNWWSTVCQKNAASAKDYKHIYNKK